MTTSEERQQVLHLIAAGKITPEEGSRLLAALSGETPAVPAERSAPAEQADRPPSIGTDSPEQTYAPEPEIISPPPPIDVKTPDTRHWWQVPFWIGAATLVAGAFVLAGSLASGNVCWVLLCGLPLLCLGILAVSVAWFARNGPWVHIRVKNDRPGERNIKLSVPLDLGAAAVRVAEPFVPQMKKTGVDDVILSMKDNVRKDQPLIIDVHDDEDGEHVQVIVG
ncbi:hypothetical protein TFLX_02862 [Thermoflexales bacterium]|nr:hypothetical protein TFLX_02862 [Thermoflexales bacterium]